MTAPNALDLLVVGSANVDLRLDVVRLPAPGETTLAASSGTGVGGKGVNQAVAAARAGARTAFVGAVGADPAGERVRVELEAAGVDASGLRTTGSTTGRAVVAVAADGNNMIIVESGANATINALYEPDRAMVERAALVLLQLEIPLVGVLDAAHWAHRAGTRVVLNAAPAAALPDELWESVDLLVVNEQEAAMLAGSAPTDRADRLASGLLDRVAAVVVTLGARGSLYLTRDEPSRLITAHPVEAVDATAAGDTYCGVLAAGLAAGTPMPLALARASAAAGLAVQRLGALASIPTAAEINWALAAAGPSGPSREGDCS
jgi:ribokinase